MFLQKVKKLSENERIMIPANIHTSPHNKVFSFDNLLAIFGVIGDTTAKAINGKLVNKLTLQYANPISSFIIPTTGPTDVIAGLKLIATRIMPAMSKKAYNDFGFTFDVCNTNNSYLL